MPSRFASFAFAILLSAPVAAAAAPVPPASQPVVDAQLKATATTHHISSTSGQGQEAGESIAADGVNYVKIRGVWKKSPLTVQAELDQQRENIKNFKVMTRSRLQDGNVDGSPATLYKVHTEMPDVGMSDAQMWISTSTGLPLRTEEDLDSGTKRHLSIRYDYANIKAPIVK